MSLDWSPPLCIVLFFVLILVLLLRLPLQGQYGFMTLAAFFVLGYFRCQSVLSSPDPTLAQWVEQGDDIIAQGVAVNVSHTRSGRQKIIVNTSTLRRIQNDKGGDKAAPMSMEEVPVSIKIMAILEDGEGIELGQEVALSGCLLPLEKQRNPGGFQEWIYYGARHIDYKMFPIVYRRGSIQKSPIYVLNDLRIRLAQTYDIVLPPKEAAIIKSIIIGDKSDLDDDIRDLYRIGGIYHVLAISGLHISVLFLAANRLLLLFLGKKSAGLLSLSLLAIYGLMTGASPSTVRAVIMAGVIIFGEVLYRERDVLSSISFACVCLLLYSPLYLFDIGFQLSFAAVFGLAILTAPIERLLSLCETKCPWLYLPGRTKVKSALSATLSAGLAICPILSYHFYVITPYSVIVNLIILPTVSALVVLGFLSGFAGLFSDSLATFLSGPVYYGLRAYENICLFFSKLPFSSILTGRPGILFCLAAYSLMATGAFWLSGFGDAFDRRRRYFLKALLLFIVLCIVPLIVPHGLQVTMLDVGQGDCFVIRSQSKTFIVDGGGQNGRDLGQNTGVNVLLPYLDYLGTGRLDGVFVTHFDYDHAAGVLELVQQKKIGAVFLSSILERDTAQRENEWYQLLINSCERYKIPVLYLDAGDEVEVESLRFTVLYPDHLTVANDINDTSLVMKLTYKEISMLFTGDIGHDSESAIINAYGELRADILKLAHHGSRYSNSQTFLQAVDPLAAVVSAGQNNRYGHPAPDVLDTLAKLRIPLYQTPAHGAVTINSDGNWIKIKTMLE